MKSKTKKVLIGILASVVIVSQVVASAFAVTDTERELEYAKRCKKSSITGEYTALCVAMVNVYLNTGPAVASALDNSMSVDFDRAEDELKTITSTANELSDKAIKVRDYVDENLLPKVEKREEIIGSLTVKVHDMVEELNNLENMIGDLPDSDGKMYVLPDDSRLNDGEIDALMTDTAQIKNIADSCTTCEFLLHKPVNNRNLAPGWSALTVYEFLHDSDLLNDKDIPIEAIEAYGNLKAKGIVESYTKYLTLINGSGTRQDFEDLFTTPASTLQKKLEVMANELSQKLKTVQADIETTGTELESKVNILNTELNNAESTITSKSCPNPCPAGEYFNKATRKCICSQTTNFSSGGSYVVNCHGQIVSQSCYANYSGSTCNIYNPPYIPPSYPSYGGGLNNGGGGNTCSPSNLSACTSKTACENAGGEYNKFNNPKCAPSLNVNYCDLSGSGATLPCVLY